MWRLSLCLFLTGAALAVDQPGPKLEASLQAVYDAWKAHGDAGMQAEGTARGVALNAAKMVSVRIAATSEKNVPQLRKAAVKSGGRVLATDGISLYAELPVPELSKMAARPQVSAIYADRPDQHSKIK